MKTSAISKGDKAKLRALLDPVYSRNSEIVCVYRSFGTLKEVCLRYDDLAEAPSEKNKYILNKELTVDEVFDSYVVCRLAGSHQKLIFPPDDLEVLKR